MALDKYLDPNLFSGDYFPQRTGRIQSPLFPIGYDISYVLPAVYLEMAVWRDLLVSTAEVFNELLAEPIKSLALIRLPETQARVYKALHMQMMGFNVPDRLMEDELYDAGNRHLGHYQKAQGRDNFVRFIGWMLDIDLRLTRLWTKDYEKFTASSGGNKVVHEGGEWYPTTHVGLSYNLDARTDITEDDLRSLFYEHAPIELVLKWIAKMQTFTIGTLYMSVMNYIDIGNTSHIDARGELDLFLNFNATTLTDVESTHEATNISEAVTFVDAKSRSIEIDYSQTVADFLTWVKTDNLESVRYRISRSSEAWVFTGPGRGKWVGPNSARENAVNPRNNQIIGLQMEKDGLNYVRSATKFGADPWIVDMPPFTNFIVNELYANALDGDNGYSFSTNTNSAYVYQEFSFEPQDCAFQITYKRSGNAFSGKIEAVRENQDIVLLANLTEVVGEDIGGGWRLFSRNFLASSLPSDTKQIRFGLTVNSVPIEVFHVGMEPGTEISSYIRTDDCNVNYRTADFLIFDTYNADPVSNRVQGTFGVSFALQNDPLRLYPGELFTVEAAIGTALDETDYDRAKLTYTGSNAALTIREVKNGAEIRNDSVSGAATPVGSLKAAISWRQPYTFNNEESPSSFISNIGIKANTITIKPLAYEFNPVRIKIGPIRGYIDGMLWIPAQADLATVFSLNSW